MPWPVPALVAGQENAQDQPEAPAPKVLRPAGSPDSLQAINDDFSQQLLQLERRRLDRLSRLAERQDPSRSRGDLRAAFPAGDRLEPVPGRRAGGRTVVKAGTPSPTTAALAHLVKIIAEADRGCL